MKPFNLFDVMNATGAKLRGGDVEAAAKRPLSGAETDSRKVQPGDLFIALKGPTSDGHDYVEAAFRNGAGATMVSEAWARDWLRDEPLALVENTEIGLGKFAGWHARRLPARRVGVTGSSGKTTTKEMIAAALGATGPTLKNEGSRNGETGVPLTLLELEESHRFAVLEMGMRGPGQIRYLAEMVQPEVGVITNIGRAHLEFLGSVENIARAKGEMLEQMSPDGVAVLPAGDPFLTLLRELSPCRVVTFGMEGGFPHPLPPLPTSGEGTHERIFGGGRENTGLFARDIRSLNPGSAFRVVFPDGRELDAVMPLSGTHNVLNALAAFSVVWALDADLEGAAQALSTFQPPAMRSAVVRTPKGALLLHDAYNANPDSMRAALEVLSSYPPRRVAILGDMLELGTTEAEEHIALGREVAPVVESLVTVGPRSQATAEAARDAGLPSAAVRSFSSTEEAAASISRLVHAGDTVLLKGSRGMKMEAIADALLKAASG